VKIIKVLILLLCSLTFIVGNGQNHFQNRRKAVQKARFKKTTKKYGKACSIFEKKRTKGERQPLITLGSGRKSKKKMAEQD
jgi:hypothetical protein